jgi:very-short-patch-repair endonuclease
VARELMHTARVSAHFAQEMHTGLCHVQGVHEETSPTATKPRATLASLAARQHGLLKTRQLGLTSGGIAKRVQNGTLHRHYRGVYSLGHRKLSREGELLAAVYAAGDGAALALLTAAILWEMSRFRTSAIHVVAPANRHQRPGFQLHSCRHLDPRDVTTLNGIPVTTVARTLVDLTDVLLAEQLANVIYEAAFRNRFHLGLTREAMGRAPGRRLSVLEQALAMHAAGSASTRSKLEDRFLKLVRGAGLPEPAINTRFLGFEVDFRWPGLCVEIDGPGHGRPRAQADDRIQDAVLEAHGFVTVRFREEQLVADPAAVIGELRAASTDCDC